MGAALEFKLVVVEGGKEIASELLSYEDVSNLISRLTDDVNHTNIFEIAAKHSATNVREQVASKDNLSEEAINILSKDQSINVLRCLVRSQKFKETKNQQLLELLIAKDPEIAQSIAGDIDDFTGVDQNDLAQKLASHTDPTVLSALAGSYNAPKKALKSLSNNADPYVASQAKEQLENN